MLVSAAYFFFLLSAYYIIRPIRDEMGSAGGVENLAWLFTGTLAVTLLLNPLFASIVARYPRRTFIPIAYRFFELCLLAFFLVLKLTPESSHLWVGRVFFVWVSVFNLFVVSVFWGFMADIFRTEQGKRLFGFIGVGGTAGALLGGIITASLSEHFGPVNLLLISIVLLEIAVQCVIRLARIAADRKREADRLEAKESREEKPIGGSVLAGITRTFRSPYLLGICAYMLSLTMLATFIYFAQSEMAGKAFTDRAARTAFFARVDIMVNGLTLVTQLFFTGRIIKAIGVGPSMATLPAAGFLGFAAFGVWPVLWLVVLLQVTRRAGEFALAKPAREVLYTVVPREDKYKSKNFIDTFVYRTGDQIGAWTYAGIASVGMSVTMISWIAVPLCAVALVVGLWLGRRQVAISEGREKPMVPEPALAG